LSVVGLWQRGKLLPAFPETLIGPDAVIVVAGSETQIGALNDLLPRTEAPRRPVILIGAGKVGQAAARALKRKGMTVHAIDRSAAVLETMLPFVDRSFPGDAADRQLLTDAGIHTAASVLLTTNDDAMNVYLAVYCRRLNPALRIVSRITHDRNVEAIHRAGADFVLSYTTLGIEAVLSILRGSELVLLGEDVELFSIPVPPALAGRPLRDSGIGSRTGMSVVALQHGDELVTTLTSETILPKGATLLMLGSVEQQRRFEAIFEKRAPNPRQRPGV
jgi:Trk K+ transport system NAD-binding subunit